MPKGKSSSEKILSELKKTLNTIPKAGQPLYITTSNRTVEVIGVSDGNPEKTLTGDKYRVGKGYLFDSIRYENGKGESSATVWIYCTEKPLHANTYPFFWPNSSENKSGDIVTTLKFSEPSDSMLEAFRVDNLLDMSIVNIIDNTVEGEVLFNEQELHDINAASNFYVPIIYESDDFLKRIVKTIIIEKGININKLKSKTDEKYILPNMKAALQGKTKMSVIYFAYWMELLGCEFSMYISDDGTMPTDRLKNPLHYRSDTGNITAIIDGEEVSLDPSKYVNPNNNTESEVES